MLYAVLNFLHAAFGAVAFVAGTVALVPNRPAFRVFFVSLVASAACLALAIAVGWPNLSDVARVVDLALCIGWGYLLFRAGHAGTELSARFEDEWPQTYVADLGFTLVGQVVSATVLITLELHVPAFTTALLAVATGVVGAWVFRQWRRLHA
jgi:hypothetical protein